MWLFEDKGIEEEKEDKGGSKEERQACYRAEEERKEGLWLTWAETGSAGGGMLLLSCFGHKFVAGQVWVIRFSIKKFAERPSEDFLRNFV